MTPSAKNLQFMSIDHERDALLSQIRKLLGAADLVQACLPAKDSNPELFEASVESLDIASFEMKALLIVQHTQRQQRLLVPKVATLASSLLAGAEASEYQARQLSAQGDEAGAFHANQNALMLRTMASEEQARERRQLMKLVPSSLPSSKS